MNYKKVTLTLIIAVLLTSILLGCTQSKDYYGFVFGTSYSIRLQERSANKTATGIKKVMDTLEGKTSTVIAQSDIARINSTGTNTPITVAEDTFFLLKQAKELYDKTSGAYNPAVFPLVKLWHFDPESYTGVASSIPTPQQIEQTLTYCDFNYFLLDEQALTVTKTIAQAQLDLGGIVKGYATDIACSLIKKNGFITIGGSIGAKGDTKRIGIQAPRISSAPFGVFLLKDGEFVSSSGDYERYYEYQSIRYHHIIAQNGYPSGHNLENPAISVTVVANSGLLTDGLSTAFMILPLAEIMGLAAEYNCKGVVIFADKSFATFGNFEFELTDNEYFQV